MAKNTTLNPSATVPAPEGPNKKKPQPFAQAVVAKKKPAKKK